MSRRLQISLAAAAALCCVAPAPAFGVTVNATTNDGGSCQIQSTASRGGGMITYGVQVQPCTATIGVDYAVSVGMVTDTTKGTQESAGGMPMTQGAIPYSNSRMFAIGPLNMADDHMTRIDVSVVLNRGALPTTTTTTTTTRRRGGRRCRPRDPPDRGDRSNDPDGRICRRRRGRNRTRTVTVTTFRLEQWIDPGPECIVTTTFQAGDTLACQLFDPLPA